MTDAPAGRFPARAGGPVSGPARREIGSRARRRIGVAIVAAAAVATLAGRLSAPAAAASRPRIDAATADSLARGPSSAARASALREWSREATLEELVWLLRRTPAELGSAERDLLAAALRRVPRERRTLGERLVARMALTDPAGARSQGRKFAARSIERPWASVFRIGVLLPDSGDFAGDGEALRDGLHAGFASRVPARGPRPELEGFATGDETPARAAAAFEWAISRCGLLSGGVLDTGSLLFAAGAHLVRVPIVLPGPTDESLGTLGPEVAQIGPSGEARGRALAAVALASRPSRVGVVVSNAVDGEFQRGFERACAARGIPVVVRRGYARGAPSFIEEVRALVAGRVDLLFWDGEAREAAALLRQLGRERVSLRVCGGEGLAPARHHREARVWLEGVQYVGAEWTLATADSAALASRIGQAPDAPHVRGWLAGRVLATLVGPDALTPEEVTARLAARMAPDSAAAPRRFLDLAGERVRLPVYTVAAGRAVRAQ